MDILAHGVYNLALQKTIHNEEKSWKDIGIAILWGILPDFIPFSIPFIFGIFSAASGHHATVGGIDFASLLYPFTHSFVIFVFVFLIVKAISKKWYLPMLGWGLHILFDIPLHTVDFYPTPFLFPISDFVFPWGVQWSTPILWIASWIVVISWLVVLYLIKNKKVQDK